MATSRSEESRCEFGQYEQDWGAHKVNCKRIIRISADYIVLIDRNNNIDWESTDKFDARLGPDDKKKRERMLSQCSIAEHMPTDGLSDLSLLSFKAIIGEAIVNCLENSCEGAEDILRQADKFRLDRLVEKSRAWYLSYTIGLSAILLLCALMLNLRVTPLNAALLTPINVGAWAIAGATLSIILRSGHLQHASYAGQYLHFVESGCRLLGGFITGQIVYLGVHSGLLFSNLLAADNGQYLIPLLALLAGASERFTPSIITKIESSTPMESLKEN